MLSLTEKFPIVVYPSEDDEGGLFTAHCLTMDVIADGDTAEIAVSRLLETIKATFEAAKKYGERFDSFDCRRTTPLRLAPENYWTFPIIWRKIEDLP